MIDAELSKFLEGVVGAVEASPFEKKMLWQQYTSMGYDWEENLQGHGRTVGYVGDMPVFISLFTAKVSGHKFLFYDATSQVVDHRMVEKWLEENLPKSAFRDSGYVNKTDANNFCNIFPRTTITA